MEAHNAQLRVKNPDMQAINFRQAADFLNHRTEAAALKAQNAELRTRIIDMQAMIDGQAAQL